MVAPAQAFTSEPAKKSMDCPSFIMRQEAADRVSFPPASCWNITRPASCFGGSGHSLPFRALFQFAIISPRGASRRGCGILIRTSVTILEIQDLIVLWRPGFREFLCSNHSTSRLFPEAVIGIPSSPVGHFVVEKHLITRRADGSWVMPPRPSDGLSSNSDSSADDPPSRIRHTIVLPYCPSKIAVTVVSSGGSSRADTMASTRLCSPTVI